MRAERADGHWRLPTGRRDTYDRNRPPERWNFTRLRRENRVCDQVAGADNNSGPVWRPIDEKFPIEDYLRLVDASANGEREAEEKASRQNEPRHVRE